MKSFVIRNGRVLDPANDVDAVREVCVLDGRIVAELEEPEEVIDAAGLVVAPGLIDLHVHLREPGQSAKETIETGTRAAAAGGFTSIVCMPNTSPVADSAGTISWIRERAEAVGSVNVFATGTITKGMEGEALSPIGSLYRAGVVAITDDGKCVQNHETMRRAVQYARMFGLPVMDHCQETSLAGGGVMNEGEWSLRLGLPGWPRMGEEIIVARNALLAELVDSPIHCQHLSVAGSVRILREARSRGIPLSGEICPHHIALTDGCLKDYDPNYKMNPPLRTEADIAALIEGVADGTITILASDHAPHCHYEKEVEFEQAPFGITGLETELGVFLTHLVHERKAIDLRRVIEMYTINPARLLRLSKGTLSVGADADITLIDPDREWVYDKETSFSLARNTPFHGAELKGRAVRTIVGGETRWAL